MADGVPITAGSGTTVATDDIAGVHYQRMKLALGADGSAADLAPGQATMANSVPVALASDQGDVNTKDNGPAWATVYTFTASADATGAVDVTAAPSAGLKIVVTDIILSCDVEMAASFVEETSGTEVLRLYMPAGSTAQVTPRSKLKLPVADKKLRLDTSAAGAVAVTVFYYSEA